MNVAKMKPCGISSSFGLKAGVQRNTKVYIDPSNRDCMAPSKAIFSSAPTENNRKRIYEKCRRIRLKSNIMKVNDGINH